MERRRLQRLLCVGFAALLTMALVLLSTFFYRPALVQGFSMHPTLAEGDWCVARVYRYIPQRGDVVVIRDGHVEGKLIVKRILGMAGDLVDIDGETGRVRRNGRLLDEPYLNETADPEIPSDSLLLPVLIPEGKLFVLGDNRNHSTDSRSSYIGLIDSDSVVGQVILRVYPFEKSGRIV